MNFFADYNPAPDRYVVFHARQGCGGLGDRLVGLVSTLVFARLTQRQFRIAWETPFPLTTVMEQDSSRIPWARQDYALEEFERLDLIDRASALRDFFTSGDLQRELPEKLAITANQHFFTWLLCNPNLRAEAGLFMFEDPARLCCEALATLFRPAAGLRAVWQVPASAICGRHSVGLQVRTLWNFDDGGGRLQPEELQYLFTCAELLLAGRRNAVLFVTADDASIIQMARRRFSDVEVAALDQEILHVDRSQWCSLDDYRATFANLYLLIGCRHLVISHWSNYGRIAAFLSGQAPWITQKASDGKLYPKVKGPYRQARLTELLSKEEPICDRLDYGLLACHARSDA